MIEVSLYNNVVRYRFLNNYSQKMILYVGFSTMVSYSNRNSWYEDK